MLTSVLLFGVFNTEDLFIFVTLCRIRMRAFLRPPFSKASHQKMLGRAASCLKAPSQR
uniref:Uncharacterized protein n=1 Tax=Anguilla anguilla TaxID=7936 RepID=A0A0E9WAR9_ANGAN